jgi:hypothetical protein
MADEKTLEARLEQLEQQNALLLQVLGRNGTVTQSEEKEIVNNGWRVLYNPKRKNPDNMDWDPMQGGRRADPDNPRRPAPRDIHTGDGMWEWGYEDPDTGRIKWSGKLVGERPPGPPAEPPVPLEKLRAS